MSSDNKDDNGRAIVEWEATEPTPLFNQAGDTEPRPRFRNRTIENAVVAISRLTGAPDPIAMQSVLATLSVAAQGHADVQKLQGTCPIGLYFLTIAKSGERKTTCDNIATSTLRRIEKERYYQIGRPMKAI